MNRAGSRVSRLGYALVAILWLFATSPLNADEMRYEGRTFEDWEADLQAHSPDVRKKAVEALAHFGPRAASALIKTFRGDPDEMVQGLALGALTEIEPQTSDTVRVVLEAATTDPTSTAGTIATMIIVEDEKFRSRIGPDTVPAFVEAMRDANAARRLLAIQLFASRLAHLSPAAKQAVPTLRELADHDPEPRIRDSANAVLKLITTGVSFAAAGNYWAGTGPMSVAIGDFNGDGKQDLAVANFTSNNWKQMRSDDLTKAPSKKLGYARGDVSVLLGNGDGSFQVAVNYGAGANPGSVAVGDFNGDAKQDLAVVNTHSNNVSILLNNQEFSQESGGAGHGVPALLRPGGGVSYGWWNVVVLLLATIGLLVLSRVRLSVIPVEATSGEPSLAEPSAWARAPGRIVLRPIWGRILRLPWLVKLGILIVILTVGGFFTTLNKGLIPSPRSMFPSLSPAAPQPWGSTITARSWGSTTIAVGTMAFWMTRGCLPRSMFPSPAPTTPKPSGSTLAARLWGTTTTKVGRGA